MNSSLYALRVVLFGLCLITLNSCTKELANSLSGGSGGASSLVSGAADLLGVERCDVELVRDLAPGARGINVGEIEKTQNSIWAAIESVRGWALHRTDGATIGPKVRVNISGMLQVLNNPSEIESLGDLIFVRAQYGALPNPRFLVLNETDAVPVANELNYSPDSLAHPSRFTPAEGVLYFMSSTFPGPGLVQYRIGYSQGTLESTALYPDVFEHIMGNNLDLGVWGDKVVFIAKQFGEDYKLWVGKPDGSLSKVANYAHCDLAQIEPLNLNLMTGVQSGSDFILSGKMVVNGACQGERLLRLSESSGAYSIVETIPGQPEGLFDMFWGELKALPGGAIYTSAVDPTETPYKGYRYWVVRADGVAQKVTGAEAFTPVEGTPLPNGDVVASMEQVGIGRELFVLRLASLTVELLKDIPSNDTAGSGPREIKVGPDGKIYFIASDADGKPILWGTDGTTAGTMAVQSARGCHFRENLRLLSVQSVPGKTGFWATVSGYEASNHMANGDETYRARVSP